MIDFNALSDEDTYGMCIEGDEGAWQYMYNYILAICKWKKWSLKDEPAELAQEITLFLIDKAIKKVKKKNKFRNFVTIMTVNKIKDSFRSWKPELSLEAPVRSKKGEEFVSEYPDCKPLYSETLMSLEVVSIIDAAVKKLSSACQRVVAEYLNFKLGHYKDYKELSRVLKMPVPTISSSVRRCLNKLVEFKEIKALRTL